MSSRARLVRTAIVVGCLVLALVAWLGESETTSPPDVAGGGRVPTGRSVPVRKHVATPPEPSAELPPELPQLEGEDVQDEVAYKLTGSVIDTDGRGVEGARILTAAMDTPGEFVRSELAVSGAEGRFVVTSDRPVGFVWAEAPGHAPSASLAVMREPDVADDIVLTLRGAAATLVGRVLTTTGAPVPHARVSVERQGGDPAARRSGGASPPGPTPPIPAVRSDDSGRFLVDGLGAGSFRIRVAAHGLATWYAVVATRPGERTEVAVEMAAGGVIGGVLRHGDGRPARGVSVTRLGRTIVDRVQVRTDDTGAFRFDAVPPGGAIIRAGNDEIGVFERFLPIRDGEETRCSGYLRREQAIHGRLVSPSGTGVSGWWVRAVVPFLDGVSEVASAATDEDGRFSLSVGTRTAVALVAYSTRGGIPELSMASVRPAAGVQEFVVDDGAVRAVVRCSIAGDGPLLGPAWLVARRQGDVAKSWSRARFARDSRVAELELPVGRYEAAVIDGVGGRVELHTFQVTGSDPLDLGRVDVTARREILFRFSGEVVSDARVRLFVRSRSGGLEMVWNGGVAREVSVRVFSGTYVARIDGGGVRTAETSFEVRADSQPMHVEIELAEAPQYRPIRVSSPASAGQARHLRVIGSDGFVELELLVKFDDDGVGIFALSVEPGEYQLSLDDGDGGVIDRTFEFRPPAKGVFAADVSMD